jgi:hypothetical protein
LRRIEELREEARYHRERYDLYKAKAYSSRPTNASRMRELERRSLGADSRLRAAQRVEVPSGDDLSAGED